MSFLIDIAYYILYVAVYYNLIGQVPIRYSRRTKTTIKLRWGPTFGPIQRVFEEFMITWLISGSKIYFWSTSISSTWTKGEFSSSLKVDQKWVFREKFGRTKNELVYIRVTWQSPPNLWTGPKVGLPRSSLLKGPFSISMSLSWKKN